MKLRVGLGAMIALMLSACGPTIVYDYAPPVSSEGRVCAAQCSTTKNYCEQSQQALYQSCQSNYQLQMQNYNACKDAGGKSCISPNWCSGPQTSQCQENYRECFAACGGTVTARVIDN